MMQRSSVGVFAERNISVPCCPARGCSTASVCTYHDEDVDVLLAYRFGSDALGVTLEQ